MVSHAATIVYDIEDLRRVFELDYRVQTALQEPGNIGFLGLGGKGRRQQATDAEVTAVWKDYLASLGGKDALSDAEIADLVERTLQRAHEGFQQVYRIERPNTAIPEIANAWNQFYGLHVGTTGLGKPVKSEQAQMRARQQVAVSRQNLVEQGRRFLQVNFRNATSLEYRNYLEGVVGQGVDAYLKAQEDARLLGQEAPDFAQFIAPLIVRTPSEKAFRSTQATQTQETANQAGVRLGIQQGLLSSTSAPEEIDAFLKELLPRAQQVVALQQQEAELKGQPFDYLDALGLGLQQAGQEQRQATELQGFVRNAGISNAKRAVEQASAARPLADIGAGLPQTLQDYLRTPYQGDERAQVEEQFFREFVNQQPTSALQAFMRPNPGFAQMSPGDQTLLERVARGEFPQWEQPGGPFPAAGGPLGAGSPVLPGSLVPVGSIPTQTASQRAANELFGFLNQGQQQGFDPFDLQGFLKTQRETFKRERLPKIDLESFLTKTSRPPRVGRTIFSSGGF